MPPGHFLNPESNNEYGRHLRVRHESWYYNDSSNYLYFRNPKQLKLNPATGRPFLNQEAGKAQMH